MPVTSLRSGMAVEFTASEEDGLFTFSVYGAEQEDGRRHLDPFVFVLSWRLGAAPDVKTMVSRC